jgi:1-acyl-sn-glycerol-3-phosphate acyltransferase
MTEPASENGPASQAVVEPAQSDSTATTASGPVVTTRTRPKRTSVQTTERERSIGALLWYRFSQYLVATLTLVILRWRATGQGNMPASGGVLLVCNHASFLDVILLGIPLTRPLNFVARSTLFVPGLGALIRSLGGFPIQREGMGASGMKETLRRLRSGGIVTLFPEGTRSTDGLLAALKPGIAVVVAAISDPPSHPHSLWGSDLPRRAHRAGHHGDYRIDPPSDTTELLGGKKGPRA